VKRILILLGTLVLALMLGGCGGSENPSVNGDDYIAQPYIAAAQPYESDDPASALPDDDEYPAEDAGMDISDDDSADYAEQPEPAETTERHDTTPPPVTVPDNSGDRTPANPPASASPRDNTDDSPDNPPAAGSEDRSEQPEAPAATQAESPAGGPSGPPEEPFGHHSHDELLEELGRYVTIESRHREMSRDELITRIVIGLTLSRVGGHDPDDFARLFSRYLDWVAETYTEQNIAVYEEMGAPEWFLDHLRETIGAR
jgi:hypothetical protein